MPGGPLQFFSAVPQGTSGAIFFSVFSAAGANSPDTLGATVVASLGADATLSLKGETLQVLPSGTAKLRCMAQANASTGNAKFAPKWRSVTNDEDPADTALSSEGTQTLTWGTGDEDKFLEVLVDLDADTIVANEIIVMDIVFETASWTLAAASTWQFSIIWQ